MRLITIPMSHYCEKARWGLAHADVDYTEEAHLQIFHYRALRPHGAGAMVPVLLTGNAAIADSTAILQFLDRDLTEDRKLYPDAQRAEIEALEERFDEQLGVETRRWVYFHWMHLPVREVLKTAAQNTPRWQRALAPILFPMMRAYLNQHLAITPEQVQRGLSVIAECFDDVAQRLEDGRPYLCSERFTAADLSFACMAAPILLPSEYGISLPTPEQAPVSAQDDIRRFREHPAGQFALRLFRGKPIVR